MVSGASSVVMLGYCGTMYADLSGKVSARLVQVDSSMCAVSLSLLAHLCDCVVAV